ncbi:MAG: acetolactate synthase small subunit [Bacteroidaceae bacterium]|nr:acetolactate synthase small subunit [Bacteroidaceae bacterium]
MEKEKTLYTLIVHSENIAGVLSQITAVFTRRQVNIESLNVSASSIKGVHKYTITAWSDEDTIIKITKQIEKKIDVIQAHYFTDKQVFIQETALFKLSTPVVLENSAISKAIRQHDAKIVEVNPNYTIVSKSGITEEIMSLYSHLIECECVLQYTRSGRIVVTQDCIERVSEYLDERKRRYMEGKEKGGF